MIETVSIDDLVAMEQWDAFIDKHPNGTPCHLSGWLRALRDTYRFKESLYLDRDSSGINAVFPLFMIKNPLRPLRAVSLPFSDYGSVLSKSSYDPTELFETVLGPLKKRKNCIELRGGAPDNTGFKKFDYYKRHILDLTVGLPIIEKKFDKRTIQYSIRKAEKAGIEVVEGRDESAIDEFYRLNQLTRKKHGVPCQPKAFFMALLPILLKNKGFIIFARYEGRIVAGSFFLTCGTQMFYKYNASDPDALRKITPNHLITIQAIRKGISEGYRLIDFGRTSPDNEGLMRYKAMWGMEATEFPYYYFPGIIGAATTKEKGLKYRMITTVWRLMPDSILDKLGPTIFRHLG
jgi:hypothetical protein